MEPPQSFSQMFAKMFTLPSISAKEQHEKQFGLATKKDKKEKVIKQKDFTPYAWLVLAILLAVRIAHGVNQA